MDTLFGLAFFLFWLWVVIAGFRAVAGRIRKFIAGAFAGWDEDYDTSKTVAWHRASVAGPIEEPIWTPAEQRHFGRKLVTNQVAGTATSPQAVIAEMERELSRILNNASEVEGNVARFERDLAQIEQAQLDWTERAGVALDKGRDMLAKSALKERQQLERRADAVREDLSRLRELLGSYRRDVTALEGRLDDARRRALVASSRLKGADDAYRARDLLHGERTAAALAGIEGIERAADHREGEAEALTLGQNPGLAAEIAALQADDALDRELAALKAQRQRPAA